jgi:hypothetical protein
LEQRQIAFREALSNLDGSAPPDPLDVADAIVKAATDASTPLRTLVDNDALFLAQLRRASDTYEAFERAIRERLNRYS